VIKMGWVSQRDRFKLTLTGIVEKYSGVLMEEYNVEGLDEVVTGLKSLRIDGFQEKFYEAYLLGRELFVEGAELDIEEKRDNDLMVLAYLNLSSKRFLGLKRDLITFIDFSEVFEFVFPLYYLKIGRKLTHADVKRIYDARVDERVVFLLDKFDEVLNVHEPTSEFFKKLKKLKWEDKETKEFHKKLEKLLIYAGRGVHLSNVKLVDFQVREQIFILSLMGCSAVNNNQDKVNMEDVVIAYKTYFKLLKTNLPALVDKLENEA
jgi:hypothetical protein